MHAGAECVKQSLWGTGLMNFIMLCLFRVIARKLVC